MVNMHRSSSHPVGSDDRIRGGLGNKRPQLALVAPGAHGRGESEDQGVSIRESQSLRQVPLGDCILEHQSLGKNITIVSRELREGSHCLARV